MKRVLISTLGLSPGVVSGAFFALEASGYGPVDKVITFATSEGAMAACERMVRETLRTARPEVVYEPRRPTAKQSLDSLDDVVRFRQEVQKAIEAHVGDGYHVLLNLTGGRRSMTAAILLGAQYFILSDAMRSPGGDVAQKRAAALSVFHLEVLDPDLEQNGTVAALLLMTPADRAAYLNPDVGAIQLVDISVLLPEPHLEQWQSKLFEYAAGVYVQKQEAAAGWRVQYNFFPGYLREPGPGEVDVYAESDDGRVLLIECKLRVVADAADRPVTTKEMTKFLKKVAAVAENTGRVVEGRFISNTPVAEPEALTMAAAQGVTVWLAQLPDDWRTTTDWRIKGLEPAAPAWTADEA